MDTIESQIINLLKESKNGWVRYDEIVSSFDSLQIDQVYHALNLLIKESIVEVAIDYHRDPFKRIYSSSFTKYRYVPPASPTLTIVR